MEQTREFIRKYHEEQLKEETLPQRLQGRFELLACIHVTETHASFLLRREETGKKYLLKRGQMGQAGSLSVECKQQTRIGQVMEQSETEIVYWMEDDKEYLLRRYIEGQNLEEYLERNPILEEREVLDIAIQICDILTKLHQLNPPLIHRDIKPQNLILDRYGTVHLIDFETSRNFDRNKRKDTKFYGTEVTAAPEQYGYAQTDERTDIYAFGKVLCYLLTGDYQVENCETPTGRLSAIVGKCCAFDPKKRYQSIEEVKRLLLAEQKRNMPERKKKFLRISGGVAFSVIIFLAGIFLGSYWTEKSVTSTIQEEVRKQMAQQDMQPDTEQDEQPDTRQDAQESDDLLYRAVAASLNKDTVTEEDLQDVVRIAVIGSTVYDMSQSFDFHNDLNYVDNWDCGTISDISLLGKMPNLSEVYLYNQQITDIDVLEGLPIRKLHLSNNKIEDFGVVEKLPLLSELFISRNPIRHLPDFSKCTKLTGLVMNENTFADLDCLKGSSVEEMAIKELNVANGDYTFLEDMPRLRKLDVWNPDSGLMEEMSHLTNLQELSLFEYRGESLDFLTSMQNLGTLSILSRYKLDLSSLEKMTKLSILDIDCYQVDDISVISNIQSLDYLSIYATNVLDLSMLPECKRLSEVCVNAQQAAYIEEHDPNHSYRVSIEQ